MNISDRKLLSLPRMIATVYIIITLILFIFGPIGYYYVDFKSIALCSLYVALFLILFSFSYFLGVNTLPKEDSFRLSFGKRIHQIDVVKFSIVYMMLIYSLLVAENVAAHGSISLSGLDYFSMMAEAYTDLEFEVTLAGRIICYTAFFRIIAIVGGVFYWDKMKNAYRVMLLILFGLIAFNNTFFVGSQKQVIDLFLYTLISFVARNIHSGRRIDLKTKVSLGIVIAAAVIVMGQVIAARVDLWNIRYNAGGSGLPTASFIKTESFFYSIFPKMIIVPLVYLSGYFSQGYRGLTLCLLEPFVPTWGMGFSFRFMYDISQWFDIPVSQLELSYPVRMGEHYGIGAYSSWHTVFPWFASDVTFIGALFIVCVFVYYWARAWRDWLETYNLWALILFAQLSILVLYIPCNNQLFQTRESILASFAIFFFWKLFRGEKSCVCM